jgi:hypothetical protein
MATRSLASRFEDLRGALHAGLGLGLRRAPQAQREAHILRHRHMRIERVILEDHGDVAVFRRDVIDDAVGDADLAGGHVLEAGDHPEQGRLPAAGRPDEDHEFAIGDRNIDAVDDFDRAEFLVDPADIDRCHVPSLPGARLSTGNSRICFVRVETRLTVDEVNS